MPLVTLDLGSIVPWLAESDPHCLFSPGLLFTHVQHPAYVASGIKWKSQPI